MTAVSSGGPRVRAIVLGAVALLAAALLGALVGVAVRGRTVEQPLAGASARESGEIAALAREIAALGVRLEAVERERGALAAEVASLRAALGAVADASGPATGSAEVATPATRQGAAGGQPAPPAASSPGSLDAERLVAAGFDARDVEEVRRRLDALELARLELRDRAAREGWRDKPRYVQELRALEASQAALRDEFGDELYDWILYATDQPNRVRVAEVLSGSAAESVGLQQGDVITHYDDRLVLDARELVDATVAGRAGEQVAVEVVRGGEELRLFVPRGPLGVRIDPVTIQPPAASGRG